MPTSSGFQVSEILTAQNTNTYLLRPYQNCIINPAMSIAQRSTSVAAVTNGYYTADRWQSIANGAGVRTQSIQALTSTDDPLADGIKNCLRTTVTTASASPAAGDYLLLSQPIEGFNSQVFAKGTSSAKPFALSFWVRSNRTGTYVAELYDNDNSRTVSAQYTISASGVWQKVRIIFPADGTGTFDNDSNASLSLSFWLVAGSNYTSGSLQSVWGSLTANKRAVGQTNLAAAVNNYIDITGVQLEPNSVCTPFENRLYGAELALCQRYFYKITGTSQYEPVASGGINVSATGHVRTVCTTPVPMRKALVTADMSWSTLVAYDGAGILFVTVGAIVGHAIGSTMVSIDWSSGGSLTTGRPVVILTQPSSSSYYFQLNAEI